MPVKSVKLFLFFVPAAPCDSCLNSIRIDRSHMVVYTQLYMFLYTLCSITYHSLQLCEIKYFCLVTGCSLFNPGGPSDQHCGFRTWTSSVRIPPRPVTATLTGFPIRVSRTETVYFCCVVNKRSTIRACKYAHARPFPIFIDLNPFRFGSLKDLRFRILRHSFVGADFGE